MTTPPTHVGSTRTGRQQTAIPAWWVDWRGLVSLELHPRFALGVSVGKWYVAFPLGPFVIAFGRRPYVEAQTQRFEISWRKDATDV